MIRIISAAAIDVFMVIGNPSRDMALEVRCRMMGWVNQVCHKTNYYIYINKLDSI